jgi:hypothetical protein
MALSWWRLRIAWWAVRVCILCLQDLVAIFKSTAGAGGKRVLVTREWLVKRQQKSNSHRVEEPLGPGEKGTIEKGDLELYEATLACMYVSVWVGMGQTRSYGIVWRRPQAAGRCPGATDSTSNSS